MFYHTLRVGLVGLILSFSTGCGGPGAVLEESGSEVFMLSSEVTSDDDDIDAVSNANNDFAFALSKYITGDGKNHFLSSYSLYTMLNMLLPGARGETKAQMLRAGNIDMPLEKWNTCFDALQERTIKFLDHNNSGFRFSFANSFWVQEGMHLRPAYLHELEKRYGMKIQTVDFAHDSISARERINRWTSEMTDGHIRNILGQDAVDENSRMILVNAMYLKALWTKAFFPGDTKPRPFTLEDGTIVDVPLMHQINRFRYVHKDGVQVVCMHYQGSDFGLVSFLPEAGGFAEFEASLNNDLLDYFASDFQWTKLDLYYPRLEIKSDTIDVKKLLIEKGMHDAFSDNADFSGIDQDMDLKLSQIVQKIYFKVDEEGTEAAASTALAVGETDAEDAVLVKFDRPFIVMICHIPTRTVLFLGRVVNPLYQNL